MNPRRLLPLLALGLLLPACMSACPEAADREAKARMFSPEEPPRAEQAAADRLDPAVLAADEAVRRRILRMPAAEMRYRLGSFQARTQVDFDWTRAKDSVRLAETAVLEQAPGGDFRVTADNDQDFGLELRWVDGTAYVKNAHGAFFERRADRAAHEAWRDEAVGQLQTFLELVDGRVRFADLGAVTHRGREAVKYAVRLADAADPAALPPPRPDWTPDPVHPEGGPDAALENRLAVWARGEPREVSGELWIDRETGVVLRADLRARVEVPAPEGEGPEPARLELAIRRDLSEVGEARTVEVPEHRPFQPRPRAVKDPLDWWPDARPAPTPEE